MRFVAAAGLVLGLVAVVACTRAIGELFAESDAYSASLRGTGWLSLGALVAGAVVLLAAAYLPRGDGAKVACALAATVGCAVIGLSGLAWGRDTDPCTDFRVDRAEFRASVRAAGPPGRVSAAERAAEGLEFCQSLRGERRGGVRRVLGEPWTARGDAWSWPVGTRNDYMGPGDAVDLVVRFGRDGRVRATDYLGTPD